MDLIGCTVVFALAEFYFRIFHLVIFFVKFDTEHLQNLPFFSNIFIERKEVGVLINHECKKRISLGSGNYYRNRM
jgi:hypothetical protein